MVPAVETSYTVRMAIRPANNPLRVLLASSPTAVRMALDYRPAPSNLARWALVEMAALTGAIFDAFADPERILDPEYRQAVRNLASGSELLAPVLRLLEEMALVGGFDPMKSSICTGSQNRCSKPWSVKLTPGEQPVHITVTQEHPSEAPGRLYWPPLPSACQPAGGNTHPTGTGRG